MRGGLEQADEGLMRGGQEQADEALMRDSHEQADYGNSAVQLIFQTYIKTLLFASYDCRKSLLTYFHLLFHHLPGMDVLGIKSGDKPKGSVILCLNEYAVWRN